MAIKPLPKEYDLSLEKTVSLVKSTLASSNDGILIVTNDGVIIDYNQKFASMWRMTKKVLETRDEKKAIEIAASQLLYPEEFLENVKDLYGHPQATSIDILKFKDGRIFERYSHPFMCDDKPIGRIWSFRDVTRRSKLETELQYYITHDVLTGLPNRLFLFDQMRQLITASIIKQDHKKFALFVIDLDRFKLINDSLTHTVGDELLRGVALRLQSSIREGDTLARIGGDEFVVIAKNLQNEEHAESLAENLLNSLHQTFKIAEREISVTASVGVAIFPKDGQTVDILLRNADTAVYVAKKNGTNRFEYYIAEMNNYALARLEQEMQLRYALLNNQFVLYYQPQFNVMTGKLIGFEALIRWQHPERGLLQPADFVPLAEETGLIVPIGEWVLQTACTEAQRLRKRGLPAFRMAVNIMSEQFKQQGLIETVKKVLNETGFDPACLELEVTENIVINTYDVVSIITSLKNMGIQITLDDFGTGSSNLSYLKKLPLNRLKIDRSFIQNIIENREDKVLVRAIIAMARAFGLKVLAEGVETQHQLDFLKGENCHEVQGFYYSEALSAADLEKFISRLK